MKYFCLKILVGIFYFLSAASPNVNADTSVLVNLMNVSSSIVEIKAESTAIFGDPGKAYLDKASGQILVHKKITPVLQSRRGIGIIIDPKGLIITNAHLTHKASRIIIKLPDQTQFEAKLIAVNPKSDLALLLIASSSELPHIPLADSNLLRLDDSVYTIGGSEVTKNSISEGRVSGLGVPKNNNASDEIKIKLLRVSFNIYEGDSGSPLLDKNGHLLGIMAAAARKKEKNAYAIPSQEILSLVQDYFKKLKTSDTALS